MHCCLAVRCSLLGGGADGTLIGACPPCTSTIQHASSRPHTSPVALCGGKPRRNVGDLVGLCAQLHEEVRELQKLSVKTRASVDDHIDHERKEAAKVAEERKLSKLTLVSQRSASTTTSKVGDQSNKQANISAFFLKRAGAAPAPATAAATPAPASAATPDGTPRTPVDGRTGDFDTMTSAQVRLLVNALNVTHGGQNGAPVTAASTSYLFGPREQRKDGAAAGVLPVGLRSKLLAHLRALDSDSVGLTMLHPRPSGIVNGPHGPRRRRVVDADYHPNTRTMVFDFSQQWALDHLRLAGHDCVPCSRSGCRGKTSPVTTRSLTHGTRMHLMHGPDGSIGGAVARHSVCHGCKAHHGDQLKAGEVLQSSKYTFPHTNRTTISRLPPGMLSGSIVHPDYVNPTAALWPSRGLSSSMECDVACKQGFDDVARKVADAIALLQDELDDEHEADALQWWTQLEQGVGDNVWATLSSSNQLRAIDQRAECLHFGQFSVKHPTLDACTARPGSIQFEAMFLELMERCRACLVAQHQSVVPFSGDGIGVDATFDVAGRIGEAGENLVTVTTTNGTLVAMMNQKDGSGDSVADFLTAVATRGDYPLDKSLILNIDDRKVMADPGSISPCELKLMRAANAKAAVQDFFHVIKHYNSHFNAHHPNQHYWTSVRFRDCARVRVSEMESRVDALLRNGKIASSAKFNGKTNVVHIDQPVAQDEIDAMKESGLYHAHFCTSKAGKGAPVPYTLRSELDMDDRFALCESDFINALFDQTFVYVKGQKVNVVAGVAAGKDGVVSNLAAGAVAVGGLNVLLEEGRTVSVTRDQLLPCDHDLVWSKLTHRSTRRDQVRAHCDKFRFRMRKGKLMVASVDEFLHQIANARKRLSLCRPPDDVPQHSQSKNPFTSDPHVWRELPLCRQLNNTNGSENNHKRIQDIHESSNYSKEMSGALTLLGVNDKNRRNLVSKGAPTPGHNHSWLSARRKFRRMSNEGVFGAASKTMPDELKLFTVPSEKQLKRAAPTASPLDQPGLCVFGRFDGKLGRGKVSKSGVVAAPLPEREVRAPIGVKRAELGADQVKLAISMCAELDAVQDAVGDCRAELLQGGTAEAAAAAARCKFGRALADIAYKFLSSNNIDMAVLPPEVRNVVAPPAPIVTSPTGSAGETRSPRKRKAETSPSTPGPALTPPNSTTKPSNKLARLSMSFGSRNGQDNHPCACGNRHAHRQPTVGAVIKLRGIPGRKGVAVVNGVVDSVRGSDATVLLDGESAPGTRTHIVKHTAMVHPATGKRCTPTCHTQALGKQGRCPQIGDESTIVDSKGEVIGVLRCDGSNSRLQLKPNGQHALIGWGWV